MYGIANQEGKCIAIVVEEKAARAFCNMDRYDTLTMWEIELSDLDCTLDHLLATLDEEPEEPKDSEELHNEVVNFYGSRFSPEP